MELEPAIKLGLEDSIERLETLYPPLFPQEWECTSLQDLYRLRRELDREETESLYCRAGENDTRYEDGAWLAELPSRSSYSD